MPTNIEAGIALLIQIPLVGIFIWYSIYMSKIASQSHEKFMTALDKRDVEFEKRNDKVCANLDKLAEAISRMDTNIDTRLGRMQNRKREDYNG